VSRVTDRLSEDDLRELARLIRATHARTAARLERERLEREQQDDAPGVPDDAG
jgi:cytochrome c553